MHLQSLSSLTPSNEMTDIILQWTLTSANARFPRAFTNCDFVVSLQVIGEVCSKIILKYFSGVEFFVCAIFD